MVKKLLYIFIFALFPVVTLAQNKNVLEFKGIPIQGTLNVFVDQLLTKGYEKVYEAETGNILKGKFAGDDVEIAVLCSPKTKTVWRVIVIYPEQKSWLSLKKQYIEANELYKKKYTYDISSEQFINPYYEGDGYEISAFKNEKASWITLYKEGIIIEIDDDARLKISYENEENAKLAKSERENKKLDDI